MFEMNRINPNFIEFEGFHYLEFEGVYYKGCRRCGGSGHYTYNGEHDRCYACDNTSAKLGEDFPDEAAAQKWCHQKALRRAAAERKREREHQKLIEERDNNAKIIAVNDPEVYNFLLSIEIDPIDEYDSSNVEKDAFIYEMATVLRWEGKTRPFSEKMIAAVRRSMERRAAAAAEAEANPAPTGRQVVTGVIASAKVKESEFGIAYKILVKDDRGFKVWCSLPKAQTNEASDEFQELIKERGSSRYDFGPECWFLGVDGVSTGVKGRRITFTATLDPSADDKSFAFGSRPSKGAWLAE